MNFDFIRFRKSAFAFSGVLVFVSILSLAIFGLNLGIDFTGGTVMQLRLPGGFAMEEVRETLAPFGLEGVPLQRVGNAETGDEVVIKTPYLSEQQREEILGAFQDRSVQMDETDILQVDNVGAVIGGELTREALIALFLATLAMILYITLRFEFKFAIATIAALFQDVFIVLGVFSLFRIEINTPFVVAILTIIGYSVNDTIVIIDRIRENLKHRKREEYPQVVNDSINQSLVRSLNTSLTTLFVLIAIFIGFYFFVGGYALRTFAVALIIGIFFGTYSSIFIASPLWLSWKQWEFSRGRRLSAFKR